MYKCINEDRFNPVLSPLMRQGRLHFLCERLQCGERECMPEKALHTAPKPGREAVPFAIAST